MSESCDMGDDLGQECLIVEVLGDLGSPGSPAPGMRLYEKSSGQTLMWNPVAIGWTVIKPCARCDDPGHDAAFHDACVFCGSKMHHPSVQDGCGSP